MSWNTEGGLSQFSVPFMLRPHLPQSRTGCTGRVTQTLPLGALADRERAQSAQHHPTRLGRLFAKFGVPKKCCSLKSIGCGNDLEKHPHEFLS